MFGTIYNKKHVGQRHIKTGYCMIYYIRKPKERALTTPIVGFQTKLQNIKKDVVATSFLNAINM